MSNWRLPENAPNTPLEAYGYLCDVATPSIEDLTLMLLIESAGQLLYDTLAAGTDNQGIKDLLARNGREEWAHAHRLSKVVEILSGKPCRVPELAENPLNCVMAVSPLTKETLLAFVEGEVGGDRLYSTWADACGNADVAALLRQNAKEELKHAERLREAASLMDGV